MILGTDVNGNVLLVCDGTDPSKMPTTFNGVAITAHVLTDVQDAAYLALPANRAGTTLINGVVAAIATPAPTSQQQRNAIQAQINTLESSAIMPRVTREALLGIAVQQALAAGLTEPQLYLANIGYHKTKDVDTEIAGLRAQITAVV